MLMMHHCHQCHHCQGSTKQILDSVDSAVTCAHTKEKNNKPFDVVVKEDSTVEIKVNFLNGEDGFDLPIIPCHVWASLRFVTM